jgi:cell surface protein SprA
LAKESAKFLMMLKNISVTYTQTDGTLLPGYAQETQILGMDNQFGGPGVGFLFGHQDANYPFEAARRGWMVENQFINTPYTTTASSNLNIRANIEPIKSFRIELTATQSETENVGGFFRFNEDLQDYVNDNPVQTGTFSSSIITWGSVFQQDDEESGASPVFEQFRANREAISQRIAEENAFLTAPVGEGFTQGYGATSQDVVIPAFLAAYTGQDVDKVNLNPLRMTPMPNWRITYDGLSKNKKLKKIFRSVTLSHAYRSTYSVGTYTTNLLYEEISGVPSATDINGNFIPQLQIGSISISEQLSPLLNIDMNWQNSLITRVELRRNRTLSFTLSNFQLTENKSNELIIGGGYRFTDVPFPFKIGGKKPKSDVNLRTDLSIRDNITVTRSMNEGTNLITSGQRVFSLKTSADYTLNRNLNLRAFYDHQINNPKVSLSFRTSNINAGIAIRFTLAQ